MSSFSLSNRDSTIRQLERPSRPSSIEPQSQHQLPTCPSSRLANSRCAKHGSTVVVKPLCPTESGIDNAVIDAQTRCAAPRHSRLLALPVEVRSQIIHLILPYSCPDEIYGYIWHFGSTSILRTCHQLHEEGTTVLYSSNTFQVRVAPGEQSDGVRLASITVVSVLTVDFSSGFTTTLGMGSRFSAVSSSPPQCALKIFGLSEDWTSSCPA